MNRPRGAVDLRKDAESAAARQVVRIARDGEELVEGGVADRESRAEHALHRAGRAEGRVARAHVSAAAQDLPVPPPDDALLVAQDDVAVVGSEG